MSTATAAPTPIVSADGSEPRTHGLKGYLILRVDELDGDGGARVRHPLRASRHRHRMDTRHHRGARPQKGGNLAAGGHIVNPHSAEQLARTSDAFSPVQVLMWTHLALAVPDVPPAGRPQRHSQRGRLPAACSAGRGREHLGVDLSGPRCVDPVPETRRGSARGPRASHPSAAGTGSPG